MTMLDKERRGWAPVRPPAIDEISRPPAASPWRASAMGDVADEMLLSIAGRYAEGMTTEEFRRRYGCWSYWNHGRQGQPVEQVLEDAASRLRVLDDDGQEVPVARDVLVASLVYLRGTVSPALGPAEEKYEALRNEHGLATHEEDREDQLRALEAAMERVLELVYGD